MTYNTIRCICYCFRTPIKSPITDIGVSLGSVAVELRQIPNEPIQFTVESSIETMRLRYTLIYVRMIQHKDLVQKMPL